VSGTGGTGGGGGCAASAPGAGGIVINEVKGQGSGFDFIELYNPTANAVDITGFAVADDSGGAPKIGQAVRFPSCTVVPPDGYAMVQVDSTLTPGGPGTCFGFTFSPCFFGIYGVSSTSGEPVYLLNPQNAIVAVVQYPATAPTNPSGLFDGQTLGRFPNGTGPFSTTTPTPGAPNALFPDN